MGSAPRRRYRARLRCVARPGRRRAENAPGHRTASADARLVMRTPFAKRSGERSRTILVIDIGGTQVKLKLSTRRAPCEFKSGPKLTARTMVKNVQDLTNGWTYQVVS